MCKAVYVCGLGVYGLCSVSGACVYGCVHVSGVYGLYGVCCGCVWVCGVCEGCVCCGCVWVVWCVCMECGI